MKKYPLTASTWDEKELLAIDRVIKSNHFTMGENVRQFESEFAKFFNSKYCVMTNSGSSANLLATAALFYTEKNKLKNSDEVIVPAVSWATTYYPLYQYGLKLKFVDIDLYTLNYDLNSLENAITEKTKLIIAVNLLGNPNDFEHIQQIIKDRYIIILEDNCESMGARYRGQYTGTIGVMGTFSLFYSHHISTMEGGMILTDDEELFHILLSLRSHGWVRDLPDSSKIFSKGNDSFKEKFQFVLPGYNLRPLEISGAIGLEQIKKLPKILKQRIQNADYFIKQFENNKQFIIQRETGKSSWFAFSLIIAQESKLIRKDIIHKLSEKGIECRPIVAGNFANNRVTRYFKYKVYDELSNADYIDSHGFYVGNHGHDINEQISYLAEILSN